MTDFRALCAELADVVEDYCIVHEGWDHLRPLVDRARAALAQPESIEDRIAKADAAIEASMKRIRTIAATPARNLAQPAPQGPTLDCDEIEVPAWHRGDDFHVYKDGYTAGWAAGVNAASDCWARPAIEPVPVAERLPGPEDCTVNPRDGQGQWCWGWVQWYDEIPYSGKWRMMRRDCLIDEASAWLPYHALPVPQQEADRG
jgi:hypothetical protein